MIDQEATARREAIFDRYRELTIKQHKIYEELSIIREELDNKSLESSNLDESLNELTRLINVMLLKDCCPIEAKLRYPELINPPETEKYDRYQPVGCSTDVNSAYPNQISKSYSRSRII